MTQPYDNTNVNSGDSIFQDVYVYGKFNYDFSGDSPSFDNVHIKNNLFVGGISTFVGVATFKDSLTAEQFKVVGFSTFLNRIDADGGIVASTAKISDLTNGRVVFAGSSGELQDDSDITFDGYTHTST